MEYDKDNRLIKYNGQKVKYDADGNMTYGPVNGIMTELRYDCRNRLIQAGDVSYEYDAENTRTAVITETSRTEYTVDVAGALSQVLEAHTTYTDTTSDNHSQKTITYVYGNGLIYEYQEEQTKGDDSRQNKESKQSSKTSRLYVHHYNNIGSTTALTDEAGNVTASYQYGNYGELSCGHIKDSIPV